MDFPSFGDATAYGEIGRACAEALVGPAAAFDACYHPVRPVGATLLMAVPFLISPDPVDAAYAALAIHIALFAVVAACLSAALAADGAVLAGRPGRTGLIAGLTFAVLLLQLVSLIPVRLADIPSLAPFAGAILVAARTALGSWGAEARRRRYAAAGLLCALAVLVNVRYFVYAFVLLAAFLLVDAGARRSRLRCAAAFTIGMAPVAAQLLNVGLHTGQVGLYDREVMATAFPPREYGVEAEFATLPRPTAYMVRAEGGATRLDVIALRLFRGISGFEWAVYHGRPARGPVWNTTTAERVGAWAAVAAYLALAALAWRKGPPSIRLITATAVPIAVLNAILAHTELRYYAFPRSVLWLTLGLAALAAVPAPRLAHEQEPERAP